jgi:hypothetical protein
MTYASESVESSRVSSRSGSFADASKT